MPEESSWYKLDALWKEEGKEVIRLNDEPVVVYGHLPPDNESIVAVMPLTATHAQGLALQKLLEAQFRKPVLLLSNNIQLAKLTKVSVEEAANIMGVENAADVAVFSEEPSGEESPA